MYDERYLVQFTIEDTVEVSVKAGASEQQIDKAARKLVLDEIRKSRGFPWDINIGRVEQR